MCDKLRQSKLLFVLLAVFILFSFGTAAAFATENDAEGQDGYINTVIDNAHAVTFEDWDGTELKVETVEHGEDATAPTVPGREGYTFTNWDTDFTNVTEDLTVMAEYVAIDYTLTIEFVDENGEKIADSYIDGNLKVGDKYDAASPVIDGYTADHLTVSGTMPADNVTVTVVYTEAVDVEEVQKEQMEPPATMMTLESTSYEGSIMEVTGNSTNGHLTAKYAWLTSSGELFVAFTINPPLIAYGKTIIDLLYNGNYLFSSQNPPIVPQEGTDYWYETELWINGTSRGAGHWLVLNYGIQNLMDPLIIGLDYAQSGFDALKITVHITDFTVTYDANGGLGVVTDLNNPYTAGEQVTVMNNAFTRAGYHFIGWNTEADGSGTPYSPGGTFIMPEHDVVLYAQWAENTGMTVSADNVVKTYDGNSYGVTATSSVSGATIKYWNEVTGEYDLDASPAIANVSDSPLTVKFQARHPNYTAVTGQATVTITPKDLTITADSAEKEYDGTALTKDSYTNSALAEDDTITGVTVTGSQTDVGSSANVASDAVIMRGEADVNGNYNISYVDGTLTVTKNTNTITITADSNSKTYDGTPLTDADYTYTQGILATGDVLTVVVEGTITNAGSVDNVATSYQVMRGDDDVTSFYTIETAKGTLTVTKKDLNITANDKTKTYGRTVTFDGTEFTVNGLIDGDSVDSVTLSSEGAAADAKVSGSPYAIVAADAQGTGLENYEIAYVDGKLTVNKKPSGGGNKEIVVSPTPPTLNVEDHFAYVIGYPNNTVRPQGHITREEVAAVFYRLLEVNYRDSIKTTTSDFPDVAAKRWSTYHIGTLANGSIIQGYPDGNFKPGNKITRAEIATIASKFDELEPLKAEMFSDVSGHWAEEYINSAAVKGWVTGYPDKFFKPNQYITRAEFVTLVNNVLGRKVKAENILPEARQFPDLKKDAWYYEAMHEAINSHTYIREDDGSEKWKEIYYPELEM